MDTIIQQSGDYIYNIKKLIMYSENKGIEHYNVKERWDEDFGETCKRNSYKSEVMSFVGRKKEKEYLDLFLNKPEKFLVSAITGKAGGGKSSLLYHYYMNNLKESDWFVKAINFERDNENLLKKILKLEKVLLVIDYVMIHADQIGRWIKKLATLAEDCKIIIRILLVERAYVTKDRIPYWYDMLVEKHRLHNVCKFETFLKLEDLSEEELKQIFLNYVINVNRIEKKKSEDVIKEITKKCNEDIERIFEIMDVTCKVPLFVLYTAQAWMDEGEKGIRSWNRQDLLDYIKWKEELRIKAMFNNNYNKAKHFEKILCFAMALSTINLGEKASEFIKEDIRAVENEIGTGYSTTEAALLETGEYNDKETKFKTVMPELVEEFYCLNYLERQKKNLNNDFIREFVEAAWEESPEEFARFLFRVVEDFHDHKMVTFEYILMKPNRMMPVQRKLYADIIRELTYWNMDVNTYSNDVIRMFDELLKECINTKEKIEIAEKYAITLFNMSWANIKFVENPIENLISYKERLFKLKEINQSSLMNEVWMDIEAMLEGYEIYTTI